jgi:mannitol-specific phosphotransferase system IIBC component
MGGGLDLQAAVIGLSAATLFAIIMAYINIKKLQIDQHRKWVLRAMIWMSLIITARILMFISARVISAIGGYVTVRISLYRFTYLPNE